MPLDIIQKRLQIIHHLSLASLHASHKCFLKSLVLAFTAAFRSLLVMPKFYWSTISTWIPFHKDKDANGLLSDLLRPAAHKLTTTIADIMHIYYSPFKIKITIKNTLATSFLGPPLTPDISVSLHSQGVGRLLCCDIDLGRLHCFHFLIITGAVHPVIHVWKTFTAGA